MFIVTYLIFVTSTTSRAGVKLFSLVSKKSSNNVYFTTLVVVVVVVVTPPQSTNQFDRWHFISEANWADSAVIKRLKEERPNVPFFSKIQAVSLWAIKIDYRCFVAKSVVTRFTRFWCQIFELEMVLVSKNDKYQV